jgi:pimeloyl-ACP methyl ester carboxylesterase
MPEVAVTAGVVDYEDGGGSGPVVVLVPGLAMAGSLWRKVVPELSADHRVLVPTLPLGSHRQPMKPDADLSPRGIGALQAEFLDALDLHDVTLVGNDSGLFQFAAAARPQRLARLVITSCEAFENFPPGLPGKSITMAARLPGGIAFIEKNLRLKAMRWTPTSFGWMAKRRVPEEVMDAWLAPLRRKEIRRDLVKYLRSARNGDMLAAAEGLRGFDRPTLVAWAAEDRVMPPAHGRRFAELLPDARLVEVHDSYTLIPEDQPTVLARLIRDHVAGKEPAAS